MRVGYSSISLNLGLGNSNLVLSHGLHAFRLLDI